MTTLASPRTTPAWLLHPRLIGPGAALLVTALVTDIVYAKTLLTQWENFSVWLIVGGLVLAGLAALALIFDIAVLGLRRLAWLRFVGLAAAALLSLLNVFIHTRDAYTAVVPEGIEVSAVVAVLLVLVGLPGWSLAAAPARKA